MISAQKGIVLTFPNILTFPRGGAQQALDRVSRMFRSPMGDGVFVQPMGGAGVATLGLKTNLVAWWELNEASGNRADSHTNALTLTDNNTVTSNPGIGGSGTAAQFTRSNSESLSRTNIDVTSGSWTFAGFVYLDSKPDDWMTLVSQNDGTNDQFILRYTFPGVGDFFRFNWAGATLDATTFGSASLSTWYFVRAWYNSVAQTINLRINETAETPVSSSSPGASTSPFRMGAISNAGGVQFMDGRMAKWGIWAKVLSDAEALSLCNGGAGVTYSQL